MKTKLMRTFIYACVGIKTNRGFPLGKDEGAKWKRS